MDISYGTYSKRCIYVLEQRIFSERVVARLKTKERIQISLGTVCNTSDFGMKLQGKKVGKSNLRKVREPRGKVLFVCCKAKMEALLLLPLPLLNRMSVEN